MHASYFSQICSLLLIATILLLFKLAATMKTDAATRLVDTINAKNILLTLATILFIFDSFSINPIFTYCCSFHDLQTRLWRLLFIDPIQIDKHVPSLSYFYSFVRRQSFDVVLSVVLLATRFIQEESKCQNMQRTCSHGMKSCRLV